MKFPITSLRKWFVILSSLIITASINSPAYSQNSVPVDGDLFYINVQQVIRITANSLKIREGASRVYKVIKTAKKGEIFEIDRSGTSSIQTCTTEGSCWWRIKVQDAAKEAWIETSSYSTNFAVIEYAELGRMKLSKELSKGILETFPQEIMSLTHVIRMYELLPVALDTNNRIIAHWYWNTSYFEPTGPQSINDGHWTIETCQQMQIPNNEPFDDVKSFSINKTDIVINDKNIPIISLPLYIDNRTQVFKLGVFKRKTSYRKGDFERGIAVSVIGIRCETFELAQTDDIIAKQDYWVIHTITTFSGIPIHVAFISRVNFQKMGAPNHLLSDDFKNLKPGLVVFIDMVSEWPQTKYALGSPLPREKNEVILRNEKDLMKAITNPSKLKTYILWLSYMTTP